MPPPKSKKQPQPVEDSKTIGAHFKKAGKDKDQDAADAPTDLGDAQGADGAAQEAEDRQHGDRDPGRGAGGSGSASSGPMDVDGKGSGEAIAADAEAAVGADAATTAATGGGPGSAVKSPLPAGSPLSAKAATPHFPAGPAGGWPSPGPAGSPATPAPAGSPTPPVLCGPSTPNSECAMGVVEAEAVGDGQFKCKRCNVLCSNDERQIVQRRSTEDCISCGKSYKALTNRWRNNGKLKEWWNNKSAQEKTLWYQEHRNKQEVLQGDASRIHWKPWSIVKRDLFMEGFTPDQDQLAEWRSRILKGIYKVQKDEETKQWLVGEYQGKFQDLTRQQRLSGSVKRDACELTSAEDLQNFMADIKNTMEGALGEFTQARSSALAGAADGAPTDVPEQWIASHVEAEQWDPVLGLSITDGLMEIEQHNQKADEYKRLCNREDTEAAAIKPMEEAIDAKSMKAVAKRQAAKKLTDAMRQKLVDGLNALAPLAQMPPPSRSSIFVVVLPSSLLIQVSESVDVRGFMSDRLTSDVLKEEPIAGLVARLVVFEKETPNIVTNVDAVLMKIAHMSDDASWNFNLEPIKAALKDASEKTRADGTHWSDFRKAIAECKTAAQKKVDAAAGSTLKKKKLTDKAKDAKDTNCSADMANKLVFVGLSVEELNGGVNIETTFEAVQGPGKASVMQVPQLMEGVQKANGWNALDSWLKEKVKAEENICFGAVTQPEIVASAKSSLLAVRADSMLFRTAFLAKSPQLAKLTKAMFGMQAFFAPRKHTQVLPPPFGIGEVRAVFEGKELVVAQQMVGEPLDAQISKLQSMSSGDLLNLIREAPNFALIIKQGDVAWLPTGFVYMIFHLMPTIGMRWGCFPSWAGEASRSRRVTVATMEAFSKMKGTVLEDWNTMLATLADQPA
ncbi:unnamed protein product [Prorocentrum cordatum]|uniref:JmjC domain-containing protein n=1 Tax=Prorocentrum cordatum TaxID=2364126 RepID=A0ABN9UJX0_9DINO|nr:unnamed protein product [Polarella glacialis]